MAKRISDTVSDTQDTFSPVKRARVEVKDDPSKLFKYTCDVVPVLVGSRTFRIHQDLITSTSLFFKNSLKPEWRIDPSKPIDLSWKDPVYFERYFEWLYTRALPSSVHGEPKWKYLANMYVLGEEITDTTFRNTVIEAMISSINPGLPPHLENVKIIYGGTPCLSPARRLLVDIYAFHMKSGVPAMFDIAHKSEHRTFLGDLFMALLNHRATPANSVAKPWLASRESYKITSIPFTDGANDKESDKMIPTASKLETSS